MQGSISDSMELISGEASSPMLDECRSEKDPRSGNTGVPFLTEGGGDWLTPINVFHSGLDWFETSYWGTFSAQEVEPIAAQNRRIVELLKMEAMTKESKDAVGVLVGGQEVIVSAKGAHDGNGVKDYRIQLLGCSAICSWTNSQRTITPSSIAVTVPGKAFMAKSNDALTLPGQILELFGFRYNSTAVRRIDHCFDTFDDLTDLVEHATNGNYVGKVNNVKKHLGRSGETTGLRAESRSGKLRIYDKMAESEGDLDKRELMLARAKSCGMKELPKHWWRIEYQLDTGMLETVSKYRLVNEVIERLPALLEKMALRWWRPVEKRLSRTNMQKASSLPCWAAIFVNLQIVIPESHPVEELEPEARTQKAETAIKIAGTNIAKALSTLRLDPEDPSVIPIVEAFADLGIDIPEKMLIAAEREWAEKGRGAPYWRWSVYQPEQEVFD